MYGDGQNLDLCQISLLDLPRSLSSSLLSSVPREIRAEQIKIGAHHSRNKIARLTRNLFSSMHLHSDLKTNTPPPRERREERWHYTCMNYTGINTAEVMRLPRSQTWFQRAAHKSPARTHVCRFNWIHLAHSTCWFT